MISSVTDSPHARSKAPSQAGTEDVGANSAGLWAGIESESSRRLLLAALAAFARRGFQAATTREIGEGAGMSPAAVYVHYESKSDLLYEISRIGHQSVLDVVEDALRDAPQDPEQRVRRFVAAFAKWHADHHVVARVIQYELKALPPRQFRRIAEVRKRFEELSRLSSDRVSRPGRSTSPSSKPRRSPSFRSASISRAGITRAMITWPRTRSAGSTRTWSRA